MERFTIAQFNETFPDDEACLAFVAATVYPTWPDVECRKCEQVTRHHRLKARKAYTCQKCGTHVYPLAGTIFEKSSTPMKSWFYAMYLVSQTRGGISAKQLERELGVTYKTAWRMFKQIRSLLDEDEGPLSGTVEVDETFVGGRVRYRNGEQPRRDDFGQIKRGPRSKEHPQQKVTVVGMVERGGKARAWVTPDTKTTTIKPLVTGHIMPESTVFTDEARHYGLVRRSGYQHRRVMHSAKVYVNGDVHTNTIEGFWSLLKNGIRGTYHAVGKDYLQSYVNEYVFRYNHRKDQRHMFKAIAERVREVRDGQHGTYAPLG